MISLTALILTGFASGQNVNASEANQSLQNAEQAIDRMEEIGLSTDRVEDLYISANRSFRAQQSLENPDYSGVVSNSETVVELKDRAIRVYDSIQAFNETLNGLEDRESLDLNSTEEAFRNAVEDLEAERYSEAESHLEDARDRLSTARSGLNQAQAYYQASTNELLQFIQENTVMVASGGIGFFLFVLIGFNEFRYLRVNSKAEHLEDKRIVVEELMRDNEKEYYVERDLDEQSFEARQRKYSEMMNHVEEKLPVYNERKEERKSLIKSLNKLTDF